MNPFGKGAVNPFDKGAVNPFDKGAVNPFDKGAVNPFGKGAVNPFGKEEKQDQCVWFLIPKQARKAQMRFPFWQGSLNRAHSSSEWPLPLSSASPGALCRSCR